LIVLVNRRLALEVSSWKSGEATRDCAKGYRTFGTLNPDKSIAALFPTAFGWRSAGLATRIGAGKLVDSAE
jgi:hypothetical protein